ncbi:anti-sigma factor domain-containing protein [Kitasatospora sp. NPDC052896]|uniref:anti-sigma factor n=1 Tax=Kitasatospora sp. NPDC052896 TaxID=3364061 RepID=UPI0037C8D0EE
MKVSADLHTLTGAYAAHALDEAERGMFERHLAQCEACAAEVAEFQATLARFGAAEALAPPFELKARVLAATASIRQLAPVIGPVAVGSHDRSAGRWPRFALAATIAAAAALGGVAVQQHEQVHQAAVRAARLQDQQNRFGALLTAADAKTVTERAGSGVGTVVWSRSRGQAGFLAQGLPALARGKAYELWFNDAGIMRPAGLLPSSTGSLVLTGPIGDAAGVGVTVEPAGGSPHPSGQPVLLLPLT